MRKLFALYTNEIIKITRKVSVIIILSLMTAGVIGFCAMMKFVDSANISSTIEENNKKYQQEEIDRQIESLKRQLDDIQSKKSGASGAELNKLISEEIRNKNELEKLQYSKEHDIYPYSESYLSIAVNMMFEKKLTISQLESIPESSLDNEQIKELNTARDYVSRFEKVVKNKDFKEYISISNDMIKDNELYTDEQKKIYIESNELRLKYNVTNEEYTNQTSDAEVYIRQIQESKYSLLTNLDYISNPLSPKPLTSELRQKLENRIAVAEYKLKKGIVSSKNIGNSVRSIIFPGMLSIGEFMILLLLMILAGSSISHEISTGSIKSLIISPARRWKIFTAKLLSLLTVGIVSSLILYIITVITHGLMFGFNTGDPYIYATNGTAHELSFYIYQFARLFTDFIMIVVFMVFALMLSTLTRNTAVSVGTTIAVYFVGSNANSLLMQFVTGEWRKFIPFNNLDFTSKIFANDSLSELSNSINTVNNSLTFMIIYILILLFCMGYTAYDSFCRRDIK